MRILCDVDGVISDFMSANIAAIEAVTGRRYTADQVTGWDCAAALGLSPVEWRDVVERHIKAPGYVLNHEPYPGAVAAVLGLAADHDLYFVTTPWHGAPTWTHERAEWLIRHFGETLGRRVVHTAHKELISGDCLIDDKFENCKRWADAHWSEVALLRDQPWNQGPHESDGVMRVNSWPEILEAVAALEVCG